VIHLAIPLILSQTAMAIQQFVDRMFLAWYSAEAVAATMSAGILNFTIINLFIGISSYVGTFVAQYYGASQHKQVGPILWQGLYIAALAGIIHLILIPMAGPFFGLVGHDPDTQHLEVIYFRISCLGAGPAVAAAAFAGFFSGQGRTGLILAITVTGNIVNVVLNYILIFGHFGFPEWGVKGAAIATMIATFFNLIVFASVTFVRDHETLNIRFSQTNRVVSFPDIAPPESSPPCQSLPWA